jgi:hypothetical protein
MNLHAAGNGDGRQDKTSRQFSGLMSRQPTLWWVFLRRQLMDFPLLWLMRLLALGVAHFSVHELKIFGGSLDVLLA